METAVDWFYDKIINHFKHDEDLLDSITFTFAIAKTKEREQHGKTWDAAIQAYEDRGLVLSRVISDFDEYEIK